MTAHDARAVAVGVDGSDSALDAVRWAAGEAHRRGAVLRLVAAVEWPMYRTERLREAVLDAAHRHLTAAATTARDAIADLDVTTELLDGPPATALGHKSDDCALLVLGTRGKGGFTGLLAGSVTVAATAHARCPVVVVRGTTTASPDAPVVVGCGGRADTGNVLGFAFEEAAATGAPLVALRAWSSAALDPMVMPVLDWTVAEAEADDVLSRQMAEWTAKFPDVATRRIFVRDGAAAALVTLSAGARLVVVGTRGHGGFVGPLLGSVSQALIHHSACPVVVVRRPASDRGR